MLEELLNKEAKFAEATEDIDTKSKLGMSLKSGGHLTEDLLTEVKSLYRTHSHSPLEMAKKSSAWMTPTRSDIKLLESTGKKLRPQTAIQRPRVATKKLQNERDGSLRHSHSSLNLYLQPGDPYG